MPDTPIKNLATELNIYKDNLVFEFPYVIHKEIKMLESMFACVATFLTKVFLALQMHSKLWINAFINIVAITKNLLM